MTQRELRDLLLFIRQIKHQILEVENTIENNVIYTEEDIEHEIKQNRRIDAMRIYRRLHNCSLKEAQTHIDSIMKAKEAQNA